jgi:hypothetical protein
MRGFDPDPFIATGRWAPVWGLNLALAWPLPEPARHAYVSAAAELASLEPALFVYPHHQTHVTVLTLVSFKEHLQPTPAQLETLEALGPRVREALAPLVRGLPPIELGLGAPALSPQAVYVPIREPAGSVARLRALALAALPAIDQRFAACRPPPAIHFTMARFRRAPAAPDDFAARFEVWAQSRSLGRARVAELLLTSETRPYMRAGAVLARFPLAQGSM